MMKFTKNNTIILMLILVIGVLLYFLNDYKTKYESTKTWLPPYFCSDENLKDINFLLNTDSSSSNFSKARAIVALKDNGCFYNYPKLVKSAQELVDKEGEVVKIVKGTDLVSVELLREFEKDPLRLFEPKDAVKDEAVLELTGLVTKFMKEMDKRTSIELERYYTK